jgi:hypothetical protein
MAQPDDFDPTHVLDGWRAPGPAPVDLDLGKLLDAGGAGSSGGSLDEAKLARLRARGYEMQDIEDIELPELRPSPIVDAPRLDLPTPQAAPDPRLLAQWQPKAWVALARRIAGASAEIVQTVEGPLVENHAPQWLCALWPPQRIHAPLLGRWPELAALVAAETATDALHQMLAQLPPEARLWPAELEADWALVADLVLHQDAGLRPGQAQVLRDLAAAERAASFARLSDGYLAHGRVARRRV